MGARKRSWVVGKQKQRILISLCLFILPAVVRTNLARWHAPGLTWELFAKDTALFVLSSDEIALHLRDARLSPYQWQYRAWEFCLFVLFRCFCPNFVSAKCFELGKQLIIILLFFLFALKSKQGISLLFLKWFTTASVFHGCITRH